jgi:predicted nucleic acid-binding protein
VLLDNEAVQVLGDPAHRKHRIVISHVLDAATRTTRARPVRVAVPTVVRVEAGYDRRSPASAFINRFRVEDIPLDTAHADAAAGIVKRMGVSVADAHLGAAIQAAAADHVKVLTSDPGDMRKAAEGRRVDVVPL